MSVLRFESEEALRFTITSGLVPARILEAPARTWREDGAIVIVPDVSVPVDTMKALARAGVGRLPNGYKEKEKAPPGGRDVACWTAIVSLVRITETFDPEGAILFWIPEGASLVELAGELVRLGCDRLEYRVRSEGHLLRASAPPYYSVLRAIDSRSGIQAYVAEPPGQDRVWVAAGWEHPLARFLRPTAGAMLLAGPEEWTIVPDGSFSDIYTLIDLEIRDPGGRTDLAPTAAPRINVPLRLAHASTLDAPSLWVLREDAAMKVERLVASLPEEMTQELLFAAVSRPEGLTIIVRLRPGRTTSIEIEGEPYRAHSSIANLFLPVAATLEPPLRRDHLRELFTPDPDEVVWLRAGEKGAFRVESTTDAAFQPLSSFVDYVIDSDRDRLVPWVRSATFDFASFVGAPTEPRRRAERVLPEPGSSARTLESEPVVDLTPAPIPIRAPRAVPEPAARLRTVAVDTSRVAEELASIERQFLALDAPADATPRLALWSRMAVLDTMLTRSHDAALSWTRVIWERPNDPTPRAAWAEAENLVVRNASSQTLLALVDPARDHVRAIAARLVAETDPSLTTNVQEVSLWLDKHDDQLDVRGAWLARLVLSRLVGGDRLGLARARDRLLGRIHGGLSLERDVPSFLRRAGRSRDVAQIELLASRVDNLVDVFTSVKRRRSATEADPALTLAYVRFVVAYGLARLGRVERARQVRDEAVAALPPSDPIHALLVRAYVARIGQALEGLPVETALPPEVSSLLGSLAKLERYKVDRVRQASKVLEPHERLDPIAAFQRGEVDPRGPEFVALRGESAPAEIDRMVAEIMLQAESADVETRARLYDGAMDFFPLLRHGRAHAHLATILATVADVPRPRRVQLLEEALMLAGHFGEEALAREILAVIEPDVAHVGVEGASAIAPVAAGMLRTLRRFGLRDEAERILASLQAAASGKGTPSLIARLHTAAALSFLGQTERARPVFEEALAVLTKDLPMAERLQLGRALSRALGAAPIEYALAGMGELEKGVVWISDSFNTNTHVCLSVLDFMDALVLGYASDDLAIDPVTRRHLDDDEYLVRRRIHKDLQ